MSSANNNVTFANSLDLDQAPQKVVPDLNPNCLTLMVFMTNSFLRKKNDVEKNLAEHIKHERLSSRQRVFKES